MELLYVFYEENGKRVGVVDKIDKDFNQEDINKFKLEENLDMIREFNLNSDEQKN